MSILNLMLKKGFLDTIFWIIFVKLESEAFIWISVLKSKYFHTKNIIYMYFWDIITQNNCSDFKIIINELLLYFSESSFVWQPDLLHFIFMDVVVIVLIKKVCWSTKKLIRSSILPPNLLNNLFLMDMFYFFSGLFK